MLSQYRHVSDYCVVVWSVFVINMYAIIITATGFRHLRILGLSSTRISNKLLLNGTLNQCKSLTQLNMSRTRISNKRLNNLLLPLLSQLNLDWTRVTSDCHTLLTGIELNCHRWYIVIYYIIRQECFTGKYTIWKIHAKLHPEPK